MSGSSTSRAPARGVGMEPPDKAEFRADVIRGLSSWRRTIPCKYLYDARGARLFELHL